MLLPLGSGTILKNHSSNCYPAIIPIKIARKAIIINIEANLNILNVLSLVGLIRFVTDKNIKKILSNIRGIWLIRVNCSSKLSIIIISAENTALNAITRLFCSRGDTTGHIGTFAFL